MNVMEVIVLFIIGLVGVCVCLAGTTIGGLPFGDLALSWLIMMMACGALAGFRASRS